MRKKLFFPLLLIAVLCGPALSGARPAQTNEARLIGILLSPTNTVREKSDACAELKLKGTERSVDALAKLLTNQDLSHSARYVLESMPSPKAGKALRRALGRTSGLLKVGLINSLAIRHDSDAVGDLGKLLAGPDQAVAIASAEALGRIGGPAAVKSLRTSVSKSQGPLHRAETDALLMCASRLLGEGDHAAALKLYQGLYDTEKADPVRQAAFRGVVLSSGERGAALAVEAIANGDAPSRSAALHVAAELKGAEATRDFADLAVGAKPPVQLALIECLVQRNDPAARPAISRLADSGETAVRLAAISALGKLGNDSNVRPLVEKAATSGAERKAAREALLELNRGPVTAKLLALLDPASPKIESEAIMALGGRGDRSATPALLKLARQGNEQERAASLQAVGQLADASYIPELVKLVTDASSDDMRSQAADALGAVYQRMPGAREQDIDPLVNAVTHGSIETRVALLPICSELAQVSVRGALRAAVVDGDARIRDAGIHALCDTRDRELLPDLMELADGKGGDSARHMAIRGCVHLTSQEDDVRFSNDKKIEVFTKISKGPLDTGDKRLLLSGLGTINDQRALELASRLLGDSAVEPEAEQAVMRICVFIRSKNPAKVRTALKKVVELTQNADTRKTAQESLDKLK